MLENKTIKGREDAMFEELVYMCGANGEPTHVDGRGFKGGGGGGA
jgi:hypothetical protein